MSIRRLSKNERDLIKRVEEGKEYSPATKMRIDGEVLRNILVGLPLTRSVAGVPLQQFICKKTGAGVRIRNAIIVGRVDLDSVVGCDGEPLCPLEMHDCTLNGGVSAAHAHFSRLSLRDCAFVDRDARDADAGKPCATIDLSGARLRSTLDLSGIHPEDTEKGLLWVGGAGLRVGGGVHLSGCRLRAPAAAVDGGMTQEREAALDLTLAEIFGDLSFDAGSSANGRLKLRAIEVRGDVWLDHAELDNPGEREEALFLQGACIRGYLAIQHPDREPEKVTVCRGRIDLTAAEVGRGLLVKARITGDIKAPDLIVRDDFFLHGAMTGRVNLDRMSVGGSLDMSRLRLEQDPARTHLRPKQAVISIADGTIGAALRLTPKRPTSMEEEDTPFTHPFEARGLVDLTGLSCDTLDDDIGRSWGRHVLIKMDHFTYRRTAGNQGSDEFRQSSYQIVADWVRARLAEIKLPARLFPKWAKGGRFWRPWQLRRNWVYQQFESFETRLAAAQDYVSITRHRIREHQYSPQPFEQAIRVARAEGREDFATHFEIHKQRLEWRFVNSGVRWPLGFAAIMLSSSWLILHPHSDRDVWLTVALLAATIVLMTFGSSIRRAVCGRIVGNLRPRAWVPWLAAEVLLFALWWTHVGNAAWTFAFLGVLIAAVLLVILGTLFGVKFSKPKEGRPTLVEDALRVQATGSKILTWLVYWIPAVLLFAWTDWYQKPFHFVVSTAIFIAIRLLAVFAHLVMRFGFGYLRRPVNAVTTLMVAFLLGWVGVVAANSRDMFVVAANPMAGSAAQVDPWTPASVEGGSISRPKAEPTATRSNHAPETGHHHEELLLTGIGVTAPGGFIRDLSCSHEISEPLYALDVLIPIVDLGEESRCEIRRFHAPEREPVSPSEFNFAKLKAAVPDLPLNDHRFWWWMKAIYAIFGWILVSLAILTFAQVNKVHAEPPHDHK